jgi:hypothetical protein
MGFFFVFRRLRTTRESPQKDEYLIDIIAHYAPTTFSSAFDAWIKRYSKGYRSRLI